MSEALKPCPFCAAPGISERVADPSRHARLIKAHWRARCSRSCWVAPSTDLRRTERSAILAWNTRRSP